LSLYGIAQTTPAKQLPARRTSKPVKIDGLINEDAWKDAATMDNLVEFRPTVGRLEENENRTVTYLMYNDEGIYFGLLRFHIDILILTKISFNIDIGNSNK